MKSELKNFKIIKQLGKGATGEVYLVEDSHDLKALKLLKTNPLKNPAGTQPSEASIAGQILQEKRSRQMLAGFKHEIETLKKLDHKNIARFYDVGYIREKKQYYLLYEYIEGPNLFTCTRELPFEKMEELFIDLLRGLNYLHSQHLYHFDLKAENVLVHQKTPGLPPIPKIIDFGISSGGLGNPHYRAPEVWLGEEQDNRTDLYALGVIFYRCLAGTFPFEGESPKILKDKHCHSTPPPPSRHKKIPLYWDRIILRLLEKNPNNRYPDAAFVIRDIKLHAKKNYEVETNETRLSYIPKRGNLIAREKEMAWFDQQLKRTLIDHKKGSPQLLVIRGGQGSGKSRLLEEFSFHAKLHYGLTVKGWDEINRPVLTPTLFLLDEPKKNNREKLRNALLKERTAPVLFVAAESDVNVTWPFCEEISIKDFTLAQVKEYLKHVVRADEPPLPLVQKIYDMTQGNPLLLTELVGSLITKGFLVDAMGPWPQTLLEDVILPGISSLSSSASDHFCAEEIKKAHFNQHQKKMAWILSALRKAPTLEELTKITGQDPLTVLYPFLNRNTLFHETEGRICFKRASLSDFIYKNIPAVEKHRLHQTLARFYQTQASVTEALWHRGLSEEGVTCVETLSQLAQMYEKESQFEETIPCYQKILEQELGLKKNLIQTKLANAFFLAGRFEEARIEAYRMLLEPSQDNLQETVDVLLEVNDLCLKLSLRERNLKETEERIEFVLSHFIPFLLHSENKSKKLFFENRRAQLYLMKNNLVQAESLFLETKKEAETLPPEEREKLTNNDLDEVYFLQNKLLKARQLCEEKLSQTSSSVQKNRCLYLLGRIFLKQGANKEALAQWEKCVESAKTINDLPSLFRCYNELGNFYFEKRSNLDKAKDYWERALLLAQKSHDTLSMGAIASNLGRIFNRQKDYHQAYHYLNYALASLEALSPSPMILSQLAGSKIELLETLRYLKERDKAEKLLQEVTELFKSPNPALTHLEFWFYHELILRTPKVHKEKREGYLEKAKRLAKSDVEKRALSQI